MFSPYVDILHRFTTKFLHEIEVKKNKQFLDIGLHKLYLASTRLDPFFQMAVLPGPKLGKLA